MQYFGDDGDRMHMMFNFQVNQNLFYALAAGDVRPLVKALNNTRSRPAAAQWGMFLRNHDELDLGRLSEKMRQKVFLAFAPEKEMQLYHRGIRRRLARCGRIIKIEPPCGGSKGITGRRQTEWEKPLDIQKTG